MIKIGITGQKGFLGTHLSNNFKFIYNQFELITFEDYWFKEQKLLNHFVEKCDVIIHLAALNRHSDQKYLHDVNIDLSERLIKSLNQTTKKIHLIFSSTIQESLNNSYGLSKKTAREKFTIWAEKTKNTFTGLLLPNLFGPFGMPNYNSVVSTFCHNIIKKTPNTIIKDNNIKLLYVQDLCENIIEIIISKNCNNLMVFNNTNKIKVSNLLKKLVNYKLLYFDNGVIPDFQSDFELNLFNTFRSYIDYKSHYPIKYNVKKDNRGNFVELLKSKIQGQFSFSTTNPNIVRGNHFHTRKIERFSVISGKALIKLRRIDSNEIISFELNGSNPSYVDMPIWYTHNIKNIGNKELITNFWINEIFNPNDTDTFSIEV